jgi:N-acetylglucosaminyl-diphospho-decaprenol L-rhamnosyltransferase
VTGDPVRVVVVAYWPGDALTSFLSSLASATKRDYRVVVANNAAADISVRRDDVTVVDTGGNVGYGAAANAGAQGGTEEWLVVANPDIAWHDGALDTLLDAAERWPRAAAFGPLIRTPEGDVYPSARAFPTLGRGIGHALLGWWWAGNPWTRAYRRESGGLVEGPCGWLSGSCLLLRRAAYDAVGGFDPAYFMYFEDLDLGRRLADAGWQSVYVPDATVTHTGGHSTQKYRAAMLRAHHDSAYRYLSGRYPGLAWLPVRLLLRAGLAARYRAAVAFPRMGT